MRLGPRSRDWSAGALFLVPAIDAQMEPYGSATWIPDRHGAHMEEIQRAGDEIGVHPHAYRWLEDERS